MDSSELKFNLRKEFGDWKDDLVENLIVDTYASYGEFQLVGHDQKTKDSCGTFHTTFGCIHTESHDITDLKGNNYKGKVFVRKVLHSCDRPSCPICYLQWAKREASKIEMRLAEASKKFGLVEHIIATVPPKYYDLSYEDLRAKIVKVLAARGIIGGALIFHGFRYNKRKKFWHWSPHWHCLGFILGGYGHCRHCKKKCFKGCGGWVDRKYRAFEKDGCIVIIKGKRKTVGGTAYYQLNHASTKKNVKRFHVVTWFGCVSYRNLKVKVNRKKSVCPLCGRELVRLQYDGLKPLTAFNTHGSYEDLKEDGKVVWSEAVEPSYYRGSVGR